MAQTSIANQIKQLGGETFIYGIAGTISRFIGIFLVPLYTRVFSSADYGIISIITALLALMSTFIVLGLDNSSARWFYDSDNTNRRKDIIGSWFWTQMGAGIILAAAMLLLAPLISRILFKSDEYVSLLRMAAVLIPLGTFSKVLGNWLRYLRRPVMTTVYFTLTSLVTVGMVILFVLVWEQGLTGIYKAQIVAGILAALVAVLLLRDWISPKHITSPLLREMLIFGLPLVPAGIAAWVTSSSDRFFIQFFLGPSDVGIYAVASSLAALVALVTTAFQMAWSPFAFSILNNHDAKQVYSKVFSIYFFLGCLLCTGISLFAPNILAIFTSPGFYGAASSVSFLAFSFLMIGATYIVSLGSAVVKRSMPIATSIFIGAGINIGLNFILIPLIGRNGAAISSLLAYGISVVYLYRVSQSLYPVPFRPTDAIICFGFSWLLIGLNFFFIPTWGTLALLVRAGMCSLFIPLAFLLGIVKPVHIRRLWFNYFESFRKVTEK